MNGPDYVWPSGVYRPREPLVYLDLNHWIGLAKAYVGHPAGRGFVGVLNACLHAAQRGSVKFPLSATHYLETQRIKDPAQRRSIAEVMEELSSFRTLLHVGVMREMEIQAALDSQLGPQREPLRLPLIGVGVAWAFGQTLRLTIQDVDGNDCATDARQEFPGGPEAFDDRVGGLQLQFERDVLMGPQDPDEEGELRKLGWNPARVAEITEIRAQQERDQATRFDMDPRWRRGSTWDVVAAREVLIEINERLYEALQRRNRSLEDISSDQEGARRFIASMPSIDTAVTLKTWAHRNRDKAWVSNDIHDIDALALAVPYCDVVVTEKHAAHVLRSSGLAEKAGTKILRQLVELQEYLVSLDDSSLRPR